MIIDENGTIYNVKGDYPKGSYVKKIVSNDSPPKQIAIKEILKKLSAEKRIQIFKAAENDDVIYDFINMAKLVDTASSNDSWVSDALDRFVELEIISAKQANSILR